MYFESKGKENTEKAAALAIHIAKERRIKNIVVSSNTGQSASLFIGSALNVVCVTQFSGSEKRGLKEETRRKLADAGIRILTTTHVLSGAERGLSRKFGGVYPVELIAHTLRMFGHGTKVCVECSVMALDAGLIPYGEEIIALGGSSRGLDTALILKPAHPSNILDTKINEIICKPRNL